MYSISYFSAPTSCNMSYFSCNNSSSQCVPWSYVCDNDPDCNDGSDEFHDLCEFSGKCGGTFTNPKGLLTSPSYPDNYPKNADCVYTISQPAGTAILLTFHSMDIFFFKCYDYLEIRDGSSATSPLLNKICGNTIPAPIQSSQNQVWMR